MGAAARSLALIAMLALAVAGCGSQAGPSGAAPAAAHPCPSGERYVAGRAYPEGICVSTEPSHLASCAPDEHIVVGRVYPLGDCQPNVRPTPIRSCPPGERLVVGRVNPDGDCYPAFSP